MEMGAAVFGEVESVRSIHKCGCGPGKSRRLLTPPQHKFIMMRLTPEVLLY